MIVRGAMPGPCLVMMFVQDVRTRCGVGADAYYLAHADDFVALTLCTRRRRGWCRYCARGVTGESNGYGDERGERARRSAYTMVYPDGRRCIFHTIIMTGVSITCYCANESSSLEDEEDEERNDESSRWDADGIFRRAGELRYPPTARTKS